MLELGNNISTGTSVVLNVVRVNATTGLPAAPGDKLVILEAFKPGKNGYWTSEDDRLPVVGCIGQLSEEKGQHLLIKAAKLVLDQGVQAHFAIVGDGETASSLHDLVRELGLELNVTFSPHISGRQALYGLFDIVAMPVLKGGVGVTAIESMAMGRPLITSGLGEMLHLVKDGETGLLFPEGDVEALAAATHEASDAAADIQAIAAQLNDGAGRLSRQARDFLQTIRRI